MPFWFDCIHFSISQRRNNSMLHLVFFFIFKFLAWKQTIWIWLMNFNVWFHPDSKVSWQRDMFGDCHDLQSVAGVFFFLFCFWFYERKPSGNNKNITAHKHMWKDKNCQHINHSSVTKPRTASGSLKIKKTTHCFILL